MQPSGGKAFLAQEAFHHPAARKRILHVQLVDPAHQLEVFFVDRTRLVLEAAPADPQEFGLAAQAQDVVMICHFFALPNRPALASAPSKKIILQRQLTNFCVQRFDIDLAPLRRFGRVIEDNRHAIKKLIFPLLDLIGMHIERRCQISWSCRLSTPPTRLSP